MGSGQRTANEKFPNLVSFFVYFVLSEGKNIIFGREESKEASKTWRDSDRPSLRKSRLRRLSEKPAKKGKRTMVPKNWETREQEEVMRGERIPLVLKQELKK